MYVLASCDRGRLSLLNVPDALWSTLPKENLIKEWFSESAEFWTYLSAVEDSRTRTQ
ncbi:hypothetical protein M413DRAFT_242260 [Hebeloma cylindrosporum]|uniref:Uncharacterized protein n=1 Tax=Hebeloma cylindrosporum TaxID=76867 RepID=A0A0C3C4E9_HEBCY|nr:hypothetical protein M413DRAFT_242260 [Hebeloma cylindrosporum h7]